MVAKIPDGHDRENTCPLADRGRWLSELPEPVSCLEDAATPGFFGMGKIYSVTVPGRKVRSEGTMAWPPIVVGSATCPPYVSMEGKSDRETVLTGKVCSPTTDEPGHALTDEEGSWPPP